MAFASNFSDRPENSPPNNFDVEKDSIYTIEEKTQKDDYNESSQQQHTLEKVTSGMWGFMFYFTCIQRKNDFCPCSGYLRDTS